jgi:hypothetical protein
MTSLNDDITIDDLLGHDATSRIGCFIILQQLTD